MFCPEITMNQTKNVDKRIKQIQHLLYPVNEYEAAKILGLAVQTLRNWRHRGDVGPVYRKVGRRVIYMVEDLEKFRDLNRIDPMTP
jgi:hypothetical protein